MSVSIPERVLEALKRGCYAVLVTIAVVSIPERVLEALKPAAAAAAAQFQEFQSLKGF